MQGANQPKSTGLSSLGEADFDCKYHEHVSLIKSSLVYLEEIFLRIVIPLCILLLAHDPQQVVSDPTSRKPSLDFIHVLCVYRLYNILFVLNFNSAAPRIKIDCSRS
jgi:hypothetical protein